MKVIFSRSKYTALAVLTLISITSLVAGALHARADEHNPHDPMDIRIDVVVNNSWLDTHSDASREAVLQYLIGNPADTAKIKDAEEHLKDVLKRDEIKAAVLNILTELSQCPKDAAQTLGYKTDEIIEFMPIVALQGQTLYLGADFAPYRKDCGGEMGSCSWKALTGLDFGNREPYFSPYLGSLQAYFNQIHLTCSASADARKLVKDSAKVEAPSLGQSLNSATNL